MKSLLKKDSARIILLATLVFFVLMSAIDTYAPAAVSGYPSIHCVGVNATFPCSKKHFALLTQHVGIKPALEALKEEYAKNPEIVSDCHQLSHTVGNTAVDHYEGNIAKAFLDGDSFCWSGYYHGVVERAIARIGEAQFIAHADSMCAAIPGKERYSFDYYNCVHGLGHGIMSATENDLFHSLAVCDNLSGDWERRSCYGGTFMENIMVDNRNEKTKFLKRDDLMYPCDAVAVAYKEQCYLMQTSYALSKNGYDFKHTFELCSKVDVAFRDTCTQSIGRDASGNSVSDIARTVEKCSLALDDNQEKNCIVGAVKDFISYYHGGDKSQTLCFAFPERFQANCLETRVSYMKTL